MVWVMVDVEVEVGVTVKVMLGVLLGVTVEVSVDVGVTVEASRWEMRLVGVDGGAVRRRRRHGQRDAGRVSGGHGAGGRVGRGVARRRGLSGRRRGRHGQRDGLGVR